MKNIINRITKLMFVMLLIVPSVTHANVIDGAKEWNGHYYKAFEFGLNWTKAKFFCESMGGHLATAENLNENTILQEIIENGSKDEYYIGGYKDKQDIWRWVTGNIITDQNWAKDYPDKYSPHMTMKRDYKSKWKTAYSWGDDAKYAFICEWDSEDKAHDSNM